MCGVRPDSICHGEAGGRQNNLPQEMLQMSEMQEGSEVRLLLLLPVPIVCEQPLHMKYIHEHLSY